MKNLKKSALTLLLISAFCTIPHYCSADTQLYLPVRSDEIKQNCKTLDGKLIAFVDFFQRLSENRNINAEAKGFSSERYSIFIGKINSEISCYVEKGSDIEKALSNTRENEKITVSGEFKNVGKGIILVHEIDKGWKIENYDSSPQWKTEGTSGNNNSDYKYWYEGGKVKVPYKYDKKKYKIFLPYPSQNQ
ncbi:MAG: hypothetical protein HZA77_09350 [Candidatus Schekmanbacteria bacterium]|nr:hypothetical protein [Candidatus Schekmanbacteria bacterium]